MKWQDWEDHRLLSSGLTAAQLAERLGRSEWSVQRRRERLKNLLPDHAQKTLLEIKIFKKLRKLQGKTWQDVKASKCKETLPAR